MASDRIVQYDPHYHDLTDPDARFGDSLFEKNVTALIEDIKWQIDRESTQAPRQGPLQSFNGQTFSPTFAKLFNGAHETIEAVPISDYITSDFSVANQYDKLLDISARFVEAAMKGRTADESRLVWRGQPAIQLLRYMMPRGLLLIITGSVSWI